MILEALGLLGGGLMRLAPVVIGFLEKGRELKYELDRLKEEKELEKLRGENKTREIVQMTAQAVDTRWADGLIKALETQTVVTGDKWLDRVNVSVRPILTYWWCIVLYTTNKITLAYIGISESNSLKDLAPILMTEFDRAVVGSIIGFWFVDRALRNSRSN
jgi:hypothetical protein